MNILLVDDDRELLGLLGRFLLGKGYQVFTAPTAMEAIALLRQREVSCIVLDVMMPDMDGFTAFPLIRRLTKAPVLFMTGCTEEADRIRGLTLGADDYILKPCSMEELSLRIAINIQKASWCIRIRMCWSFRPCAWSCQPTAPTAEGTKFPCPPGSMICCCSSPGIRGSCSPLRPSARL